MASTPPRLSSVSCSLYASNVPQLSIALHCNCPIMRVQGPFTACMPRPLHMPDQCLHVLWRVRQATLVRLEPPTQRSESLVWHDAGAHNSHLGDARATDMGIRRGEVNVGQLMRERVGGRHPDLVANLGFTTHTGTVAAADDWNEPVKNKRVNPSLPGVLSDMRLTLPHAMMSSTTAYADVTTEIL